MSRYKRIEILEPYYPSLFVQETSSFAPKSLALSPFFLEEEEEEEADDVSLLTLDLLRPVLPRPFELFDTATDLIRVERTPSFCSYKRIQERVRPDLYLRVLCDRVSALESRFDQLVGAKIKGGERKYTWTEEIKGPVAERKYTVKAEIKGEKTAKKKELEKKKLGAADRNYKWTAEFKRDGIWRKYAVETTSGDDAGECSGSGKKEKKEKKVKKKEVCATRLVEIEEPGDNGAAVLRQAFAKRAGVARNSKGKQKELSPQDAALLIQMTFRAYLIRRSQALRALRELAIAKSKLKEIRALFNNFSYRRHVTRDAEERQRFSEKIIVLLLTVDAIEGADLMVRAAKKSMVDELEAMLDVVDPHPQGKSLSFKRRTFDMPDGVIRKEIAEGVAQVVQMLDQEENGSTNTSEACL